MLTHEERWTDAPVRRVESTAARMKEGKVIIPPTEPLANYSFTSPSKPTKRPFSNRIEDYELRELLGRGGFGFVHKAISKCRGSYGREVAIKLIDKKLMKASNMTRRVANEVEVHWQLHHSSVLELYNYFEDTQYVYLVMELCKQGELYRYIQKRKQPLSEPEARHVLSQITRGLMYLHANGIIHRDLKLSNLLLTDNFDVKIADFGLAVKLSEPDGEQKTMCGTPNYISPEIVSRQPYGLMSDVWSLGCMVVTLLTGTPPFESSAVKQTLDRVSRVDYVLPDSLSVEAKDLITRLLQKDPKRRLPLNKILAHPFFSPSLPFTPLRALGSECIKKTASTDAIKSKPDQQRNGFLANSTVSRPVADKGVADKGVADKGVAAGGLSRIQGSQPVSNTELDQQLPPFSTVRLKPLKQKTKHGNVAILNSGWLYLDFVEEPFLLMISPDSQQIDFFERHCDPTLDTCTDRPWKSFTRSTLPTSYAKKFRYACRFVDLVRSKTPKILFYSPQAKCILMENGPLADFEMTFHNSETKVHYSVAKNSLQITCQRPGSSTTETHTIDTSNVSNLSLQSHLIPIFKHVQDCLRQCLDVESSSKTDGSTKYPMIIKASSASVSPSARSSQALSPTLSLHPSSMSTYTASAAGNANGNGGSVGHKSNYSENGEGRSVTSKPTHSEAPVASMESKRPASSILKPETQSRQQQQQPQQQPQSTSRPISVMSSKERVMATSIGSSSSAAPPESTKSRPARSAVSDSATLHSKPNGVRRSNNDDAASVVSASTSANGTSSQAMPCYLRDVGWCIRNGDGKFLMLFQDGIAVTVEAKHQTLLYCDYGSTGGASERFAIDRNLPDHVKSKLVHFPVFLQMFK
ncbi:hypothetical protein SmJEL517_g01652 [Synchytrium microbalum]|uniref:Uncharacterized protein n=1 Tax=Synchytrium microbalum TaxID=1806994 RepID=A0A507C3Q5_9FUNG|nr:uncharacterized protein SmJEL517_g01652 [Synchytrium microbalum]TPX36160.1 hypothetical protein SmJEL517_g01652 [Synchytrium microbalum]